MEHNDKDKIYVIGHKNPDTDSICSAIAYAYLKNQSGTGEYIAKRAGHVSTETQYVLERFNMEAPGYVPNVKTRVKDMEIRRTQGVSSDISLKKAWTLLNETKGTTLPIIKEGNVLEGLISIGDIARSYMAVEDNAILSKARTQYSNILETLDGTLYVGDPEAFFDRGKVIVAASSPEVMESYIEEHDMVILGNRYETQLCAIEMKAGCLIICGDAVVTKTIQILAKEKGCTIIATPYDTYAVAHLINQSMPVRFFMKDREIIAFSEDDFTDDIKEIMASKRHRDFPILDKNGHYVGTISRRNLLGIKKRRLILVDHNEPSQAVDNIESAEIMEIIDHHRLGSLETMMPVYFRNQPVGCTCTIIYQMYQEQQVEIPEKIAGLMCAAIISDTLLFRSPTCTPMDKAAAQALAKKAGVDCQKLASAMFAAGSNLKSKTAEEIFYQDFKKFEQDETTFGVAQISSMTEGELAGAKEKLLAYMKTALENQRITMLFFMLTDILNESTELLCFGEGSEKLVKEAFGKTVENGSVILPGIVSRKKQLIPALFSALQQ
ncbi:DHHA2 domain protein [Marvinbryantia formatexigens DSM 14469]|uniref:inorganic diphosphatase n=1 Tax=Marvinbryantia formatexigens DSM 14469 TaxID=478749 RepID=C6LB29_9FIRM|nr:putative manganese-dependent inorganic diphosphatase [Marvinbryantia formatexigens]EET62160.1 DHHA2 domain protein [Marvinbryantia formatexigens DSM 14469]UWO26499.1 putative manganese-dependent inorganic diphosphatase [Marvinbryantia formatexigens DSM 14469]SDF78396.1 manganese-dependent inorganic pyrophosphatase [Marvinbryantia formatexigens]